ncbi:hypothetical protein N7527_000546 [Penicillium freii]|nr:hypothetical protein N7527_000546 [Penicillium freii]
MQERAQMVVWIKSDNKLAQETNTMCKIDALLITVYEDLKARGWLEDDPKVTLQFETTLEWGRLPIRTNYTSVSAKPTTRNYMACHLVVFEAKQGHGASTSNHGQILAYMAMVQASLSARG